MNIEQMNINCKSREFGNEFLNSKNEASNTQKYPSLSHEFKNEGKNC